MKYSSVLCSSLEIPSFLEGQRQKGSVQQRGEGEKQLEVDRRLLRRQKNQLEEELEHVRTHRQLHRQHRKDTGAPVVALVGYTNAGKSTLLNRLASAHSPAEDKLFATLDPMTRRVRLAGGQEFLLTDTVGFVQRLPTTLVAAFRATLEEVAEADLLVHVVDTSSPSVSRQIETVEQVLEEIGAGGCCISENLVLQFVALDVLIPYDRGELVALFHRYGMIEHESYEETGTHLRGHIPTNHSGPFAALLKV